MDDGGNGCLCRICSTGDGVLDPGFLHIWLKARVHKLGYLQSLCPTKDPAVQTKLKIHSQEEKGKFWPDGGLTELLQNTVTIS